MRRGTSAKQILLTYTCFGLGLGLLAVFGWRDAAPYGFPVYAPIPPDLVPPGNEPGFILEYDHEKYLSGPSWMPSAVVLPLMGLVVGVVAGSVASCARRRDSTFLRRRGFNEAGLLLVGALIGLFGAVYSLLYPPRLRLALITTPAPGIDPYAIEDAPRHFELGPVYLTFPAVGCGLGALTALVWIWIQRSRALSAADED